MEEGARKCPGCKSEALYKYGKSFSGKQRYLCLSCNRQFVEGSSRYLCSERPLCKTCGKPMHLYRREKSLMRFRCSDYPKCRTYLKISTVERMQR